MRIMIKFHRNSRFPLRSLKSAVNEAKVTCGHKEQIALISRLHTSF